MDVFVLCVLRLAVTMINENLIHQKKGKEGQEKIIYILLGIRQLIPYMQ